MNSELRNIISKIYTLYIRYGVKSITMDDIAKELGISKKTIYNYFKDKTDLVEKVFDYERELKNECFTNIFAHKLNAIEETLALNKFLTNMLKEYNPATEYDLKKYYSELYEKRRLFIVKSMYEYQLNNLDKGIKEGLYRKELNPEAIARLTVLRFVSLNELNILFAEDFLSPAFFKEVFIYHIRGIASDRGLTVLNNLLTNNPFDTHD